ncbi:DNA integration/recombination protein [Gottschalkia acidurici 9a]|uniref:DNA integration/recombination protein n=1 Tax=Gottschalkia acidurici (strain ATCC 7906 / DSM 604 / BCRC 14475 / CIP 104303 / KCTC 5404 / NCIMB 10678 / 9a) TaxID=1128398 RepID=K0AX93_GOTA9|nr:tyrosine-type recombinase/integrase [Gottschalkia acidurici]AFS78403.1 DNA integration/recombination protein [Gottschalkia acidurici 9a]
MSKLTDFEFQIEDFMIYCVSKKLSTKTTKSYEQTLKLFAMYMKEEHSIDNAEDVKTAHIRHYIKYLQEIGKYTVQTRNENINFPQNRTDNGKQISPNTINNYIRNIKVFYNYLVEERVIRENPLDRVKFLKKRERIKESLSRTEINVILSNYNLTSFYGYRDYIITKLLLTTGARIGETLSLLTEDIDFKNKTVLFKDTKNKKEKIGYLSNMMMQDLRRWVSYKDRYMTTESLFPTNRCTKLKLHSYEKALKRDALRGGIENVLPHRLRATFAIRFLKSGGIMCIKSFI